MFKTFETLSKVDLDLASLLLNRSASEPRLALRK